MNKCLKITITLELHEGFLQDVVQQNARDLELEGMAQPFNKDKVKIVVCGKKENVDSFVDMLHKASVKASIADIEIEPFVKDKDYRGVFRVIE